MTNKLLSIFRKDSLPNMDDDIMVKSDELRTNNTHLFMILQNINDGPYSHEI